MGSLLWFIYEVGLGLALLIAGPFLLARRGRHYLPTLSGRLGGGGAAAAGPAGVEALVDLAVPRAPAARGGAGGQAAAAPGRPAAIAAAGVTGGLWLHAVSVGEVGVAATLARALPADVRLVVTTVTPTGQAQARRALAGRAEVAYLPFDLRPAVRRFWRRFTPAALVLVEGDYWPLVLREARRRGLAVAVVNGRVGDRSFSRMRRLRPLAGLLFGGIERFGVQSAEDRDRLLALGVDAARLTVTGNLKFETAEPPDNREVAELLHRLAGGRPVLIAGSTMAGEDEQVIAAFRALGAGRRALLLLAPRHPERWDEVERLLRQSGMTVVRRSAGGAPAPADRAPAGEWRAGEQRAAPPVMPVTVAPDVLLLDSLGELAGLYRQAAAVFIGGTLVPTGGHNPLEAARYGVPIAVGPAMHNFRDMAERFDSAGAWQRVASAAELGRVWGHWLADADAARRQGLRAAALLEENRGALARTLEMLAPLLARCAPPASPDAAGEAGAAAAARRPAAE